MLPVGAGQGGGGSVIRDFIFFRSGLFFCKGCIFFMIPKSVPEMLFYIFFRFAVDYFLESHVKF